MARILATVIGSVLLAELSAAEITQDFTSSPAWRCVAPATEPCVTQRGRLSGHNGIAHTIWLVGTKRVVAVSETQIPEMLSRYLSMTSPDHSDVYGDFEICPLEPDQPRHMRMVCVTGATRLVIQDRDRSRPPVRLLATWPKERIQ